jgi:7-cyano-7-deazaguanine synthase
MAMIDHGIKEKDIIALSIQYGQKHDIEIAISEELCNDLGIEHRTMELSKDLFIGGGSTITKGDDLPMPHQTYKELMEGEGPSPTYVPYRNGNLLSAAAALALTAGADYVYFGAHAEDAHNWAYPDCTPEFIGAMANAIWVGTYHKVRLATPLEWLMKKDIVRKGWDLEVPFERTHSCYEGRRPACGKCPTCIERLAAFNAVGPPDPLPYA